MQKPERTISYRLFVFLSIFSSFCKNFRQIKKCGKALQIVGFLAFDSFDRSFSAQSKVPSGSVESIPTSTIFQIEHWTRNLRVFKHFSWVRIKITALSKHLALIRRFLVEYTVFNTPMPGFELSIFVFASVIVLGTSYYVIVIVG